MFKGEIGKLGKYSRKKITLICDGCDIEKTMTYKLYTSYGYSNGDYLCRKCKQKQNNLEKYGVENVFQLEEVKQKSKKTIINKYGVDNVSKSPIIKKKKEETSLDKYGETNPLKSSIIKEKIKNTVINRYGVDNVSKIKEVQDKKEETSLGNNGHKFIFDDPSFYDNLKISNKNKYGVEYIFQDEGIKEKIKQTNLLKYGEETPSKNIEIKNKIKKSVTYLKHRDIIENNPNIKEIDSDNRMFKIICDDCNEIYDISYALYYKRRETKTTICTICNEIDKHQSGKEVGLYNFIKSIYSKEILVNHRINNKELDIYLPDDNIAFEFNGVYYHSELFKEKNYHLNKTRMFNDLGINLIHVWEDDWDYKRGLIESMIKAKLGLLTDRVYGRKCEVREVDNSITYQFLDANHIQGRVNASIKLGLYNNGELVSLMTFKRNKNIYQLNRFCNKQNLLVIGGASKLLKNFIENYSSEIETFSDNSYSNGKFYEKLGFAKEYELKPDYKYVVQGIREHKFNFRKKDVSKLYRVYDAGKIKFRY